MGMWDPIEQRGEKFELLHKVGAFVLVQAKVRPKVETQFGPRSPVDLGVGTTEPGMLRKFSGFGGGLVAQLAQLEPSDLPAVVAFTTVSTPNGDAVALRLIDKVTPPNPEAIALAASSCSAAAITPAVEPPSEPFSPLEAGEIPAGVH
jgi:hypothetical protein